jgi:hypothetical protein
VFAVKKTIFVKTTQQVWLVGSACASNGASR